MAEIIWQQQLQETVLSGLLFAQDKQLSGLQSGVLFLFPHIFKVCLAARTCKTLDVDSASDMWFRQPENLFQYPAVIHHDTAGTKAPFLVVWAKIILPCFLQSVGAAIGEIPPYWMTRSARIVAIEAEHLHLFLDEDSNALSEDLDHQFF